MEDGSGRHGQTHAEVLADRNEIILAFGRENVRLASELNAANGTIATRTDELRVSTHTIQELLDHVAAAGVTLRPQPLPEEGAGSSTTGAAGTSTSAAPEVDIAVIAHAVNMATLASALALLAGQAKALRGKERVVGNTARDTASQHASVTESRRREITQAETALRHEHGKVQRLTDRLAAKNASLSAQRNALQQERDRLDDELSSLEKETRCVTATSKILEQNVRDVQIATRSLPSPHCVIYARRLPM